MGIITQTYYISCIPLNARNVLGIISSLLFIECLTKINNVRERCERQVERTYR